MPQIANAHALVIGIANYQGVPPLPPVLDAQDIARLLADPDCCGYPPENVQLLREEQATATAIRAGLAGLAQRAGPDATVFCYLSGHGGQIASGPYAGAYVLPVDARYPPAAALAQTAISGAELAAALAAIPARKMVVVFDCCHAAGVAAAKNLSAEPELETRLPTSLYDTLKAGRGRVVLASSRGDEYSYVLPGASYGLFTQHLLAGLEGGIASADGLIHIFDLFEYLQPRVTAAMPHQHPIFKAELEDNFPVALYRGGRQGSIPIDGQGFRYDAYISYADQEPDTTWVWDTLLPRLAAAGLRVAVSGDVEAPGVARVVGIERAIQQAKRTVVVLSAAYLADHFAAFENALGQTMGLQEGTVRLLPVDFAPLDPARVPPRLSMLTTLHLGPGPRAERDFARLERALQGPLPPQ